MTRPRRHSFVHDTTVRFTYDLWHASGRPASTKAPQPLSSYVTRPLPDSQSRSIYAHFASKSTRSCRRSTSGYNSLSRRSNATACDSPRLSEAPSGPSLGLEYPSEGAGRDCVSANEKGQRGRVSK
jgi:hypothetical protein